MTSQQTVTWLKSASGIVIAFSLSGILATMPFTDAGGRLMLDLAFWPIDGVPGSTSQEARLLWAISSGILTGWGLMLWQISSRLYPRDPGLARSLILTSMAAWFVVDGLGSIIAGAPMNALFNTGFLAFLGIPLMRAPSPVAA